MSDSHERLYALPDCTIQPVDSRAIMLIRIDTGALALVDARWRGFLHELRRFRTLKAHAATIARKVPELRGQEQSLERNFSQLVPRGLLYSSDEVIAQIKAAQAFASQEPRPLTLCIRTCDRPDFLRRLLNSLVENAHRFQTRWPIEILDDSKTLDNQRANQALAQAFLSDLTLTYVGLEEQEAMIQQLCNRMPEDCDALRWLMDAKHPANQHHATYGRLYNIAFMRHAGERILLIDDDTELQVWQWPRVTSTPSLQLLSIQGAAFQNPEAAYQALQQAEFDPIGAHAVSLGQPLGSAIPSLLDQQPMTDLIQGIPIDAVPHPDARLGVLRYTHNGFLGDSGATSDLNFLLRLRADIPSCVLDSKAYQDFKASPRCVFSNASRPELISGTHLHHTTCIGLDLHDLIPPVLPRGRSEDALLGALLRFLYPGDFGLRLPFALEHRIHEARAWAFEQDNVIDSTDPATALGLWTNLLPSPAEITPIQRLELLRDSILVGLEDGQLKKRLRAMLIRSANESLTLQFRYAHLELNATQVTIDQTVMDIPHNSAWRNDIRSINEKIAYFLRDFNPDQYQIAHLDEIYQAMGEYAQALPAWKRALQGC